MGFRYLTILFPQKEKCHVGHLDMTKSRSLYLLKSEEFCTSTMKIDLTSKALLISSTPSYSSGPVRDSHPASYAKLLHKILIASSICIIAYLNFIVNYFLSATVPAL